MSTQNISTFVTLAVAGVVAGYSLFKLYTTFVSPTSTLSPDQIDIDQSSDQHNLAPEEYQQLYSQFHLACEYMSTKFGKSLKLSNTDKLHFYALFKIATIGQNKTSKPSMLDFERSAMWAAWTDLKGCSKVDAMMAYVELVHKNDPNWREKVISKSLGNVLGENASLACDPTQSDEDEEDKAFAESRTKTNQQRDNERRIAANDRQMKENEEKQSNLRAKYSNMFGTKNDTSLTENLQSSGDVTNKSDISSISSDTTQANANNDKKQSSEMGPVFSKSSKFSDNNNINETLEAASFSINTLSSQENPLQDATENSIGSQDNDIELIEADADQIRAKNTPNSTFSTPSTPNANKIAHSIQAGEVFIRIHVGSFHDLVELDDLLIFQEVIENENILAIIGKHSQYTADQLKNDQDLLFSFSVILVDVNRITLLHSVAEYGSVAQMSILLHTFRYPLDLKDAHGNTPLMLAIGSENAEMVEWLVKNGANVHEKQTDGTTIEELIDLCEDSRIQLIIQAALSK